MKPTVMSAPEPELRTGLGPLAATALVAGNIVGSGIYVMPATLAAIAGPLALVAWVLAAGFNVCLTHVFANLGAAYPISGGLQVPIQRAFGDRAGLVAAFLYWVSQVIGNAAYATAFVGYFAVFVPSFERPGPAFVLAQVLLWGLTLVNLAGIRTGGAVGVLTTALKIAPLILLTIVLFPRASADNLVPFAPQGLAALFPALALVGWVFLGAESATVPAEEVRGRGGTVRLATWIGFGIACALYLALAAALALGVHPASIAGTPRPLAVAASLTLGSWGETFVTLGALAALFGVLNGWLLVTGRLAFGAARQGLAPAWLGRVSPRTGAPVASLVLSSAITSLVILLYFQRGLLEVYNFAALASTATSLITIGGACLAATLLFRREPERFPARHRITIMLAALAGITMVAIMLVGAGAQVLALTAGMIGLPLAFDTWRRRRIA